MNDPDVILRIGRNTDCLAKNPVIGQGLRPIRVNFKTRRHDGCGLNRSAPERSGIYGNSDHSCQRIVPFATRARKSRPCPDGDGLDSRGNDEKEYCYFGGLVLLAALVGITVYSAASPA